MKVEEFIAQFSSLGVIGVLGYILLKKYLEDSEEDRNIQQEERKEDRGVVCYKCRCKW